MANKDSSELIRPGTAAFDRWLLPSFGEGAHVVSSAAEQQAAEAAAEQAAEPEALPDAVVEVAEDTVQPLTLEQLEAIRQEAYNDGFATGEKDGFHAGQLKARQEAEPVLAARVAQLEQLMQHLLAPIQEQDQAIEVALVQLVSQLAQEVIRRELSHDSSQIRQVVQGALKLLPMGAQNIRIHLNPQDFEQVKQLRERHEESWRLFEDETLAPGGCRIETEHSLIDASVETRLEQALKQLFEQQRQQATQPLPADISLDLGQDVDLHSDSLDAP